MKKRSTAPRAVTENGPSRDNNRDLVLEVLRRNQPISRVAIARRSGLQRSTISSIIERLIAEGWIREGSIVKTARGRRPTMLSMNDDLVILVADVRPTRAILAIVDLNGRFLSRTVIPLISDPKRGVDAIAEGMLKLRAQFPDKTCEGVGLSLPGRVDRKTQKLSLAPNLPWAGFDIRAALQKKLQLQIELENAANACMLSEVWFGRLEGVRNAVLITISEGVGAALMLNGALVEGANGSAGELGHISISESGPKCACGEVGCWEMYASSRAALRYFHESSPHETVPTVEQLMNMEASGNEKAQKAMETQARAIGRGLRMVTAAFNPEIILFAGDITLRWELMGRIIEEEVKKRMLTGAPPKIVALNDGESARLLGAAAVVLQRHTGYQRQSPTR
ncbi:Sugar kinase of the NBD/HSP70 family, may contain an N-terminal HTH domain [Granulicella pectinivorans]|jgi:predicted NBD/HSP70 family sugar kinase|uniref:Sugar kinase of the NBD/HSP70 family, may contain an N-terminal HTH domain n=1 Tax=Granulicella pectinivorans TaxID=474950 RepID=A0A1I6MBM6_9BACT|nr:ROK family transcriptional regulator [Granulicella pectinivorans]SFS12998.1 Sugar kinase of the NBD/HSP70 family, may contain an N-terminal HTH domain [Granulicella pectinivorans]